MDYFIEKCREVYFSTDEYSEASFIVANFGLYTIFVELAMTGKDATSRVNYHHYMQLSKDNLEAAMASLNILMPATLETVMALSLGVSDPKFCFRCIPRSNESLMRAVNAWHRNL